MTFNKKALRVVASAAALGLAGGLGACDSLLEVENPGVITTPKLADTLFITELAASPESDFQRAFTDAAYASAILSDEAVTGHNFTQWQEFDLRNVRQGNSVLPDIYVPLQRTRASGESMTARIRSLIGDEAAATSPAVARALTFGAYGNVLLGEMFCRAPVDPNSAALSSDEILQRAAGQFEEAIQILTAANQGNSILARTARVGAARAYLNLGNRAKAVEHASVVPANFVAWVEHDESKTYLENPMVPATQGTNRNLGVDKYFRDLNDPRVKFGAPGVGHNGATVLYVPFQSPSYQGFSATDTVRFTRSTDVRFASGLEAQYIVAEAQGGVAPTLTFVNSRRAAFGKAALPESSTPAEIMAELRVQRALDFYLDGHRLGDLRRYKKLYNVDLFPTGAHPTAGYGNYGTDECYIPDRSELIGNPEYN